MSNLVILCIHFMAIQARLLGPGGVRSLVAESLILKHQLLIVKSLTATIAEFMRVGPHPRRLDGALGTSYSSAPFRNRSEAFETAWPSQSYEQAKVPRGSYRNVCRRCNGSGQCLNCEEPVRFQRGSCNYHT